jgi:hypothetical protein
MHRALEAARAGDGPRDAQDGLQGNGARTLMNRDAITIVSGLPRSGTSMMMRMLEAGGLDIITDETRKADDDNPKGYYELERVKQLKEDASWLAEARGKVVKVISALLVNLPRDHVYQVVFMRRRMQEILDSQQEMLRRRGKPADPSADGKMAALYEKHLKQTDEWMRREPNLRFIYVDYNRMLDNPAVEASRVSTFLGDHLDTAAMIGVVDLALYRQQR